MAPKDLKIFTLCTKSGRAEYFKINAIINQTGMKVKSAEFKKGIVGTDRILFDGKPQFAFIGRSNVGKSSVINSLVNQKNLVKVGKKPGKTTEINFFLINNQFYLVDLPGYGYAKVSPEKKEKIRNLILWYITDPEIRPKKIVLILDVKAGLTAFDEETIELLRDRGHDYIIVANKADKLNKKDLTAQLEQIKNGSHEENIVIHSATTKLGANDLANRLFN